MTALIPSSLVRVENFELSSTSAFSLANGITNVVSIMVEDFFVLVDENQNAINELFDFSLVGL